VDMYLESPENFVTPQWLLDEVHKVSHRKYCNGFYFGHPNEAQYYETGGYIRTCDIVGVVEESKDGVVYCTQRNKFLNGDTVEVLSPNKKPVEIQIQGLQDEYGNDIETANHAMMKFSFKSDIHFEKGSIIRKNV